MAIARGTAVNGGHGAPNFTTSASITVNSGDFLVAAIATGGNPTDPITGVTWDGGSQAMSLGKKLVDGGYGNPMYLYVLQNPTAATSTVTVSGGSGFNYYVILVTYTGVKTSGQPSATSSATAAATTVTDTITTIDDNSWSVLLAQAITSDQAAGAGLTKILDSDFATMTLFDSNGAIHPAGNYAQTWTATTLLGDVSIALSPSGGATFNPGWAARATQMIHGVS